jgi:hypothetical protein
MGRGQRLAGVVPRRRLGAALALLFLAGALSAGLVLQIRMAECDWSGPISSFDSSHPFVEGTAPFFGVLVFGTVTLLALSGVVAFRRGWVRIVLFVPFWVVALIALFLALPRPCHTSSEPRPFVSVPANALQAVAPDNPQVARDYCRYLRVRSAGEHDDAGLARLRYQLWGILDPEVANAVRGLDTAKADARFARRFYELMSSTKDC